MERIIQNRETLSNHKIATGKRITNNDLFKFISDNIECFVNMGCVDLNQIDEKKINTLDKLEYNDVQKINYFPINLSKIFKLNISGFNRYLHYGGITSIELNENKVLKKYNITLFSSVIYCLYSSFSILTEDLQHKFISGLFTRMKKELNLKYSEFNYSKYKWTLLDMQKNMDSGIFDSSIIKYLSDYLSINIFIIDLNLDKLYFAGGNEFIPFKKNIFLIKYSDGLFEPLFTEQSKTFSINDNLIKYIIANKDCVNIYFTSDLSSGFNEYTEPLVAVKKLTKKEIAEKKKAEDIETAKYVKSDKCDKYDKYDETQNAYIESDTEEIIEEIFEKSPKKQIKDMGFSDDKIKIKKSDIKNTMKLDELQKIAISLDLILNKKIDGKTKTKTKQELIDEIKSKL